MVPLMSLLLPNPAASPLTDWRSYVADGEVSSIRSRLEREASSAEQSAAVASYSALR